jgi:hypothetical protein
MGKTADARGKAYELRPHFTLTAISGRKIEDHYRNLIDQ